MHEKSTANKNLALFDFDGTLCNADSFTGFIFYTLSKRHIAKRGLKILPWIQAYYLKRYPAHKMRPRLFHAMFKQIPANDLQQLAQQYLYQILPKLNQPLLDQLRQHQAQGDDVVLVSASLDIYLKPICDHLGIDLICTQTEISLDHYTGYYQSQDCSCEQKRLRVEAQYNLSCYNAIYAYGNSEEDREMLALADYPYMVGEHKDLPVLSCIQYYVI